MAWLHTWAGLLPGWLLFIVFLFGTTAFFQPEISRWMRPELQGAAVSERALDEADRLLRSKAQGAAGWSIVLPGTRGGEPLAVSWMAPKNSSAGSESVTLDPGTGREVAVRGTRGGAFLYRMHFSLHYLPSWLARKIVWIAALAMLVAILSGVVAHKKIFANFFTFRLGRGQRSWLDAHNVAGVLALPFHVMITYTGLVTLLFTLMPWALGAHFADDAAFQGAIYPKQPHAASAGVVRAPLPLRQLVERATTSMHGAVPAYILIRDPGNAASVAEIYSLRTRLGEGVEGLYLNAATGTMLAPLPARGPAYTAQTMMVSLHGGFFAGPMLRWLYFLSGVGGTAMVTSGLILWTVKRRAKLVGPERPDLGFRLVERLNIGIIAGGTMLIAAYFLANRLLPLGLDHRDDWEINSGFIAWGALFVWTLARPVKRAWVEALIVCATAYAMVPIASAMTTSRGLIPSLLAQDWVFVGFDTVMLATAACLALSAWKISHDPTTKATHRRDATSECENVLA